jgi:hypothetical protein
MGGKAFGHARGVNLWLRDPLNLAIGSGRISLSRDATQKIRLMRLPHSPWSSWHLHRTSAEKGVSYPRNIRRVMSTSQ